MDSMADRFTGEWADDRSSGCFHDIVNLQIRRASLDVQGQLERGEDRFPDRRHRAGEYKKMCRARLGRLAGKDLPKGLPLGAVGAFVNDGHLRSVSRRAFSWPL